MDCPFGVGPDEPASRPVCGAAMAMIARSAYRAVVLSLVSACDPVWSVGVELEIPPTSLDCLLNAAAQEPRASPGQHGVYRPQSIGGSEFSLLVKANPRSSGELWVYFHGIGDAPKAPPTISAMCTEIQRTTERLMQACSLPRETKLRPTTSSVTCDID